MFYFRKYYIKYSMIYIYKYLLIGQEYLIYIGLLYSTHIWEIIPNSAGMLTQNSYSYISMYISVNIP